MRNLFISMVLGPSPPTLDLQFRRNLTDLEIEHLQSLIFYCFCASFLFYCKFKILVGVLSSTSLFTIKSFFLALFMSLNLTVFQPAKFLWKSKAPLKVKVCAWFVIHRKVTTNDLL